jgi:hypothetical protein
MQTLAKRWQKVDKNVQLKASENRSKCDWHVHKEYGEAICLTALIYLIRSINSNQARSCNVT